MDKLPIRPPALDVNDDGSVTRGVAEVLARGGGIDVLVNNAGIGGRRSHRGTTRR
jgi:NAD(P)-dependent dehydrogenase (short-subunit alcohol dehydrogenase family)